jgi:predicted dehydrogenase
MADRVPRVALIGANGHGLWHRRVIAARHDAGRLRLVGMCDLVPIRDEPEAPVPSGTRLFTSYQELLAVTGPDLVVICTPPHTHVEIATAAARAGADLLLEKPPVLSTSEHRGLAELLAETGRVCQVGFQALGSAALAELLGAMARGRLGRVAAVSAVGAWQRPDSYYRRAPWAGRRTLAGQPVLDGALANPFAHALMQCLAIAETVAPVASTLELELERYRARPIEVDDTAVVRLLLPTGLPVLVAVTLCADRHIAGEVMVHAERGRAVLWYTEDRLWLPGEPGPREVAGREVLLDNLLAHRDSPEQVPLLVPLARTYGFTAVVEAIAGAPDPAPIDPAHQQALGEAEQRVVTVPGISALLRQASEQLALPSELCAEWGGTPHRTELLIERGLQTTVS